VGGQQSHVTVQPHCMQSNRFVIAADVSIQSEFHVYSGRPILYSDKKFARFVYPFKQLYR